jgi:uncharacterized protein
MKWTENINCTIKYVIILALCITNICCTTEQLANVKEAENPAKPLNWRFITSDSLSFDSAAAQTAGVDQYGMRQYVMAFLKQGPNRNQDSATAALLQKQHLENINRMAADGKLIVAGPFMDDGDIRGIYISNVSTIEEAEQLTASDPAFKKGRLAMELHPWYSSAALQWSSKLHKLVENTNLVE